MKILAPLYETSTNLLTQVVGPITVGLMDELRLPIYACLVVHFIIMALRIGGQVGQHTVPQFGWEIIKVNLITFAALTIGGYQLVVVQTTEQLQSIIATALSMGTADTGATVYATLDGIVEQGIDMAMDCLKRIMSVGFRIDIAFLWGLAALAVMGSTLWVAGVASFMILGATLLIGMLTAIGPLFLASLLFPATQRYALSWVNAVITQIITITLGVLTATIAAGIFASILSQLGALEGGYAPLAVGSAVILSAGLMAYLYRELKSVAANLSGGIATNTMAFRDAIAGATATAAPLMSESTRQDLETGHMQRASRLGHAYTGNSRLNKKYNARTASNFGKHYAWRSDGAIEKK